MPHVNIKYFSLLNNDEKSLLVDALTQAVTRVFCCDERVVSIALEPVEKASWHEQVYIPEIINRNALLCKQPHY